MVWFLIIVWGTAIDSIKRRPEYTYLSIIIASFLTLAMFIYSGWKHYISAKYGKSTDDDDDI